MPDPLPALAPAPALFDVTTLTATGADGTLARVALERARARPQRAPRRSPPTASSGSPAC